jgi:hypothetical protein
MNGTPDLRWCFQPLARSHDDAIPWSYTRMRLFMAGGARFDSFKRSDFALH